MPLPLAPVPSLAMLLLAFAGPAGAAQDSPGYLGIRIQAVNPGGQVVEVYPGTGAEAAGLDEGDVILSVDDEVVAGLTIKEIVTRLKGEVGSTVRLSVERFPGGGTPVDLVVTRGASPPSGGEKGRQVMPPVEREANMIGSSLRGNRLPDLTQAVTTWKAATDTDAVDRALLRGLRDADALGWASNIQLTFETRDAFWKEVGSNEAFTAFLATRGQATRLTVAAFLARHPGSATRAQAVLSSLPGKFQTDTRKNLERLAAAAVAMDPVAAAAVTLPVVDVWEEKGWVAGFGPRPGDLLALEIAQMKAPPPALPMGVADRQAAVEQARVAIAQTPASPPAGLPTAAATRLERSGLNVPWPASVAPVEVGRVAAPPAPGFSVENVRGGTLNLAEHQGPLIITFFATWCGPCREELPKLQELRNELHDTTGLEVWALSVDRAQDREKVLPLMEKLGLSFPAGFAGSDLIAAWEVGPVPRLFVLDAEHKVVIDHSGYSEESMAEMRKDIGAIARKERSADRVLGQASWGAEAVRVAGVATLDNGPKTLVADASHQVWAAFDGELDRLTIREGVIGIDPKNKVPLPFPSDLVLWADLDGDGTEELVTSRASGGTVRAGRPDGTRLWNVRGDERVGGIGTWRDRSGNLQVVVVRISTVTVPPVGTDTGKVVEDRFRLQFIDATGHEVSTIDLPQPVVDMGSDPVSGRLVLFLADGQAWELGKDHSLGAISPPLGRLRGLRFVPGIGTASSLLVTGESAYLAWRGGFGPGGATSVMAMTGGGDLVGLDAAGQPRFRLDLQRRPITASGDLDGDGREELVLYALWFGLAALQAEYE